MLGFLVHASPKEDPKLKCSPLANLDLRRGDILTEINGIQLDRPEAGKNAFSSFAKSDRVQVKVTREKRKLLLEGKKNVSPCPQENCL